MAAITLNAVASFPSTTLRFNLSFLESFYQTEFSVALLIDSFYRKYLIYKINHREHRGHREKLKKHEKAFKKG